MYLLQTCIIHGDACNTKTQIAFLNNYNIIVEKHVHSHMQVSNCSGVGGSSSVSLLVTDHIGFFKREIGIITDVSPSGEVYLHSSRGVWRRMCSVAYQTNSASPRNWIRLAWGFTQKYIASYTRKKNQCSGFTLNIKNQGRKYNEGEDKLLCHCQLRRAIVTF